MRKGSARVVVVEYLEDSLSEELLSKFPHHKSSTSSSSNSDPTLDFNYSESSIWSPLVKPRLRPIPIANEDGEEANDKGSLRKTKKNKKISAVGFKNLVKQTNKKNKTCAADLAQAYSPIQEKRWANMLKVGSKHFKKISRKKDHTSHISLSNCFHNFN